MSANEVGFWRHWTGIMSHVPVSASICENCVKAYGTLLQGF